MPTIPIYRALANAFHAEGADTPFVLTGDGNMHWEVALSDTPGVHPIHVRHEHCAVAMATSYAVATGKVGVASVTCGPGLTQIMTALATAAQARIPVVVFAGESPMHAAWYNQDIDQAPLVRGTGAHYIAGHSPVQVLNNVRDAFYIARARRQPVVLGVPLDLQQQMIEAADYTPSTEIIPDTGPMAAHPAQVERAANLIRAARRIVIVGGRGVMRAGAQGACEALADRTGALLATTLPVRGLFDHNPRSLGIAGGFSPPRGARAVSTSRPRDHRRRQSHELYRRRRNAVPERDRASGRSGPAGVTAWTQARRPLFACRCAGRIERSAAGVRTHDAAK